jgi:ribosome-binding ATPase YchF (GTP1/OBG family)
MGLECGIVGLPNVGKSTLFNALTNAQVPAENFPFCTVDPHRGVVNVPDPRLNALTAIVKPERVVAAMVTFVDIAGLVKGASSGEGLGNQFLSHIREVNAIAHVVRCFRDENIIHVMGAPEPKRDIEIIELELCLSDLDGVKKRYDKIERLAKSGNAEARLEADLLSKSMEWLGQGIPLRRKLKELEKLNLEGLLTSKPVLYVANIAEADVKSPSPEVKQWISEVEAVARRRRNAEGEMKLPVNLQPTPRKPKQIEHGKEPKMNEQWEEIRIEDVQPGDVARCNGREWQVVETIWPCRWLAKADGRSSYAPVQCQELGFTFHRRVKREPRTFYEFAVVNSRGILVGTRNVKAEADHYANAIGGTFFIAKITELLDGEDGA